MDKLNKSINVYMNDLETLELLPATDPSVHFYCAVRDRDCESHYFTSLASAFNYVWEPILEYYREELHLTNEQIATRYSYFTKTSYPSADTELLYYLANVPEDERYNGWVQECKFE